MKINTQNRQIRKFKSSLMAIFRKALIVVKSTHLSEWLLFGGAFAAILWAVYFSLVTISIPYQIELREGTAQVLTRLFLSGENPYVLENQPLALNIYGLGYNLAVLPFALLFGNTLLVHRSVTFVFIILSSVLIFMVVYKSRKELSPALVCSAFIMIGLIGYGGIGAFSSAMGTFLFLAAVFLPCIRTFDRNSLALSSMLAVAAFYTKPYFVLSFGIVISYMFLYVSKKKGLIFGSFFFLLFTITATLVRSAFPLYFINTVVANMSMTHLLYSHMFSQLSDLFRYFWPVLLLTALMLVQGYFKNKRGSLPRLELKGKLDFFGWQQPLVWSTVDYYLFVFFCSLLAFMLVLGPHIGNKMNYAYQLLVPTYLCWFFQRFDFKKQQFILPTLLIVFNLFAWQGVLLNPSMLEQKYSKAWAELFGYVQSSSNILNSSIEVSRVIDVGLTPIDAGQTIVFYNVKPFSNNILTGLDYDTFRLDGFRYTKFIDKSIEKQKFDLIIIIKEKGTFYHVKRLNKYYYLVTTIGVDMPQTDQHWTTLIWKPLPK